MVVHLWATVHVINYKNMKNKILLSVFIVSSFVIGMAIPSFYAPIIVTEIKMINTLFTGDNSFIDVLKVVLLLGFHVSLFSLFFVKSAKSFDLLLYILPIGFLLSVVVNLFLVMLIGPQYLLTFLPFLVVWIIVLYRNKAGYAFKMNASL